MSAAALRSVVDSTPFKTFIIAAIFLAGIVVGLETNPGIVATHGPLLHGLDRAILLVFVLEILLKLASELPRPWRYFRDPWNVFDFSIVAVCLLPFHSEFAAVLRLARVLRVLRLVTALPKLQLLVGALLKSIPSMGYVGLLLSVLFYIYGVTGVFFFGKADPQHFGTLGDTLLTLFGVITLEGWTGLMYDLLRGGSGVSPIKVVVYFISFVLFGTMIMLNLFIGVIMNSMQEVQEEKAVHRLKAESTAGELEAMERELEALKTRVRAAREKL
ncbi:MAG: ion transporter [Candidatus Methylacidiphilales bacterium]|nr:ion transporter [Candidatus Methylacidiphilales bacterium]